MELTQSVDMLFNGLSGCIFLMLFVGPTSEFVRIA
jgi:hypothetical protein